MKLSTAIREGAKLRPQACGSGTIGDDGGLTSCAILAALEAITGSWEQASKVYWAANDEDLKLFPILECEAVDPTNAGRQCDLWWLITELNDDAKWSRERIADFVETVEEYQAIAVTADAYATV